MARDIGIDYLILAVQQTIAVNLSSLVKSCDFGTWQIPAQGTLSASLPCCVIQHRTTDDGLLVEAGAMRLRHKICVTYLRYLDTATEVAGWNVIADAKRIAALFMVGRLGLPETSQTPIIQASGIHVKYCWCSGLDRKDGFELDFCPIEVVELPIIITAEHYDLANMP